jgi:hypothetical protein
MAGNATPHSVAHMYACAACGNRLGIYEPLVWVRSGAAVEGSVIAFGEDPAFDPATARLLHLDCTRRSGEHG